MVLSDAAATLWTAVAAAGGAVLSGGVTAFVTYRVTERQVRSSERTAEDQRHHERTLAEDERRQARIFDAYQVTERYLRGWVRVVQHELRPDKPVEATLEPEGEQIGAELEALFSLVASNAVLRLIRPGSDGGSGYWIPTSCWSACWAA